MSTSLVEFIQKKLGYPPLQKVDPVDHEIKHESERTMREKLGQGAIPAVLACLYKFTKSEEGRNKILSNQAQNNWLDTILEDKEKKAVEKVAHYAGVTQQIAEENMLLIAVEAVQAIRESITHNPTHEAITKFVSDQRHSILVYLPAAMQLGSLLEDDSLDDRTNKMEGPISNLMHSIENKFSGGE
ncbi:MAG: hypothetical protein ABIR18_03185 [Chitinophagaceae bacterium]